VLNSLGGLSLATLAAEEARHYHGQALTIAREIGAHAEEADALAGIGLSLLPGRRAALAGRARDLPGHRITRCSAHRGHAGQARPGGAAPYLARRAASRRRSSSMNVTSPGPPAVPRSRAGACSSAQSRTPAR